MKLSRSEKIKLIIATIFLFTVQLLLSWEIAFRTGWDPGAVVYGARYAALKDSVGLENMSSYFSIYPNNLFLTFVFSLIFKINFLLGGIVSNDYLLLIVFQCIISTLSGTIVYLIARYFANEKWSWIGYILFVLLVGTSGWLVVPYSDSAGLIFPVLQLYLYLKFKSSEQRFRFGIFGVIMLLAFVGYKIKPTIMIIYISIFIIECMNLIISKKKIEIIKLVIMTCLIGIIVSGVSWVAINSMKVPIDEERGYGITHWLMIGVNDKSTGGWNQEDMDYSDSFNNCDERNKADFERAIERVNELGYKGYIDLLGRKLRKTYGDGTFGWGSDIYEEIYPLRDNIICPFIRDFYYVTAPYGKSVYVYNRNIRQTLWIVTLLAAIISFPTSLCVLIWKKSHMDLKHINGMLVVELSLIGVMIYQMLFEAHPRYLFIYVPFFIIAAIIDVDLFRVFKDNGK